MSSLTPGDDLPARGAGELLEVGLLDLLHGVDLLAGQEVEDDAVDPLLADDDIRARGLDVVGHLAERLLFLVEEILDLGRVLDVDLALDLGLLDLERRGKERDLRPENLGRHAGVCSLLVEEDPVKELRVPD